jgi:hypothetical protein
MPEMKLGRLTGATAQVSLVRKNGGVDLGSGKRKREEPLLRS